MNKFNGILLCCLAAVIYGFGPFLIVNAQAGGASMVSINAWRLLFSIPIAYVILKCQKKNFDITKKEALNLFILGNVGGLLTAMFLFQAYNMISTGMATTLHFTYPILVNAVGIVLYKEGVTINKILALSLAISGVIAISFGDVSVTIMGVIIAMLSSSCFAFYIIFIERAKLADMGTFKLTFYSCLFSAPTAFLLAYLMGDLTYNHTPASWGYIFGFALLVGAIAASSLQLGIKVVGGSTASLICCLEPVFSVIVGVFLLGETVRANNLIGCALIILAVITIVRQDKKDQEPLLEKASNV